MLISDNEEEDLITQMLFSLHTMTDLLMYNKILFQLNLVMLEDETIKLCLTGLILLMNHFPKRQIKEKRSNNRVCVLHSKYYYTHWVVPEKIHTPPRRKFLPSGRGGEKILFLIIVNVLGHPKRVGGLTSYFLSGGWYGFFLE